MTTPSQTSSDHTRQCAVFEERLAAWLEGELTEAECSMMDRHHADCAACGALVADIDEIVREAKSLPPLTPSRDLWRGIEARLGAPVISLESRREEAASRTPARHAGMSVRWFAVAATMLVAVSSGVTWTVARARYDAPATGTATTGAVATGTAATGSGNSTAASTSSPAVPAALPAGGAESIANAGASSSGTVVAARRGVEAGDAGGTAVRNASRSASSMRDVDAIYEREISALRRIVEQRFTELDPETVAALKENLKTIDDAIADSRRALERDPRSGLLSTELDRTLEAKLSLMRRVALL